MGYFSLQCQNVRYFSWLEMNGLTVYMFIHSSFRRYTNAAPSSFFLKIFRYIFHFIQLNLNIFRQPTKIATLIWKWIHFTRWYASKYTVWYYTLAFSQMNWLPSFLLSFHGNVSTLIPGKKWGFHPTLSQLASKVVEWVKIPISFRWILQFHPLQCSPAWCVKNPPSSNLPSGKRSHSWLEYLHV